VNGKGDIKAMKQEYYIRTKDGMIPVKGYPCVIPGYEQFKFFFHRPYYHWENSEPYFGDDSWMVSEVKTGRSLIPRSYHNSFSNKTRKGALEIVLNRFESMGRKEAIAGIKKAIKAAKKEVKP